MGSIDRTDNEELVTSHAASLTCQTTISRACMLPRGLRYSTHECTYFLIFLALVSFFCLQLLTPFSHLWTQRGGGGGGGGSYMWLGMWQDVECVCVADTSSICSFICAFISSSWCREWRSVSASCGGRRAITIVMLLHLCCHLSIAVGSTDRTDNEELAMHRQMNTSEAPLAEHACYQGD